MKKIKDSLHKLGLYLKCWWRWATTKHVNVSWRYKIKVLFGYKDPLFGIMWGFHEVGIACRNLNKSITKTTDSMRFYDDIWQDMVRKN